MPIPGTCPVCGTRADITCFITDVRYRECMAVIARLPRPVATHVIDYMTLFRPETGRAITAKKLLRLLQELNDLLQKPQITWKGQAPRPNTARAWGMAIERILTSPPRRLPLQSHGYLRSIAYEIADQLDAEMERTTARALTGSHARPVRASGQAPQPGSKGVRPDAPTRQIPPGVKEQLARILQSPEPSEKRSSEGIQEQIDTIMGMNKGDRLDSKGVRPDAPTGGNGHEEAESKGDRPVAPTGQRGRDIQTPEQHNPQGHNPRRAEL